MEFETHTFSREENDSPRIPPGSIFAGDRPVGNYPDAFPADLFMSVGTSGRIRAPMAPIHSPNWDFDKFSIPAPIPGDIAPAGMSFRRVATDLLVEAGNHGPRLRGPSTRERRKQANQQQSQTDGKQRAEAA